MITEGANGEVGPPTVHEGYVEDVVMDRAIRWMKQKREKPFCLIFWFQSPHAPFFRPRRLLDLYNGIPIPKPATFDDDLKGYPGKPRAFADADDSIGTYVQRSQTKSNCARTLEEVVKDYYAGIVAADENVGKLFQALQDIGQSDDTAIMFSADHGFFLGEWRKYDKRFMHEPSIRTPMLIRYPRMIHPGSVAEQPMVTNLDIAPTFLELAGIPVPKRMQGLSMVPFLKGGAPKTWRQDWLYEYYEYPGPHNVRKNRGVRTDRYKFIHYYERPEEFEMYDLQEDPGELRNLYGESRHAGLARDLRHRIDELRRETDDHYVYQPPR